MQNKKKVLIFLLGMLCMISSINYTYAYFSINEKIKNSVKLSIGSINSNFIMVDEKTPYTSAIVNIKELTPGTIQKSEFFIKNTGTLTSKVVLFLDNFNGDGLDALLPYLSYTLTLNNKVFEGRLKDLQVKKEDFYFVDSNNNAVLLKKDDKAKCSLTLKLDKNTPYTAQNKTVKFNINIYATQPNDPNWIEQ